MLDKSIYHFRGLYCRVYSICNIPLANNVDPDRMTHYVASDLGLYCLPVTLLPVFPVRMG